MLRSTGKVGLAIVVQGSMCSPAPAQDFNVRHDLFGWQQARAAYSAEQTAAGDLLVFGNGPWLDSATMLTYSSVCSVERFDASGDFLAQDTAFLDLQASYIGWSNCSTSLPDGRVVVSGGVTDGPDTNRASIYWFSSTGMLVHSVQLLPISRSWIAYQHKNTSDGGFILTGVTSATGVQDIFLLKTDSLGNVQWWQTYGHPTRSDIATSVDHAPDGGYYIGGDYLATPDGKVQWIVRTDSVGNLIWQVWDGQPVEATFSAAVLATFDGNVVYAAGKYSGGSDQEHWPHLAKLDTAGNTIWDQTYGTAFYGTGFFSVAEITDSHDLIACGQRYYVNNLNIPYSKGILLRANSQGDSLWMREYAYFDSTVTDCEGTLRDVQPTPDGGFVAVGTTYGAINGNNPPGLSQDVWVVKVDSMGCLVPGCNIPLGITTQITNLKGALCVAPNPAHGQCTVQVELPETLRSAHLRFAVVSAQGRLIREQKVAHGSNTLDLSGLAPGLYHLHLANSDTWLAGAKLIIE